MITSRDEHDRMGARMTVSSRMWTGQDERDDVIVPLAPGENAAHPIDDRHYFEHWYFDALLDDGHMVIGFVQTSELVRRKPGVELHVYKPGGEKLSVIRSYPNKDVTASVTGCDVRVGDNRCYASLDDGSLPVHHLHLAEDNMEFDLTFENLMPGWKPGVGRADYNDREFFAWIVPAPKARVSGTVRFEGTRLDASGTGYHDHNWGVGDMKRIIDHWYWGRVYAGDYTLLYAYVITTAGYELVTRPLMLALGDEIVLSTGEMELESGPSVFDARGERRARGRSPGWRPARSAAPARQRAGRRGSSPSTPARPSPAGPWGRGSACRSSRRGQVSRRG